MKPDNWEAGDLSVFSRLIDDGVRKRLVGVLGTLYTDLQKDALSYDWEDILALDFLLQALGAEGHDG